MRHGCVSCCGISSKTDMTTIIIFDHCIKILVSC